MLLRGPSRDDVNFLNYQPVGDVVMLELEGIKTWPASWRYVDVPPATRPLHFTYVTEFPHFGLLRDTNQMPP